MNVWSGASRRGIPVVPPPHLVVFLASDAAGFITGGHHLVGGYTAR
jgi:hypothetical protein